MRKNNIATVEVINQNNCLYNVFEGSNANGDFLGAVGANQTKSFEIELGSMTGSSGYFYADPQNCGFGYFGEQYNFHLEKDKTSTILIN